MDLSFITTPGANLFGAAWPVVWAMIRIVAIVLPLLCA
jgi:hypothetical protein